jgi:maltose/moltooligosaccharide transporter
MPDSVKWSFYIGAAILLLCVLYTFVTVKELNPQEYAEFHGLDKEQGKDASTSNKGFIALLKEAPSTFWTVGLVQFFCWSAFMYMWTYSNGAIASLCFNWDGGSTQVAEFQDAGNWVGVVFAVQAIGSLIWAGLLPVIENAVGNKKAYAISLLVGAVGFISIFYVHDQYLLFLSYALIGATWAAMLAIPFTILTNSLKGDNMGFYLGLFNCTICLPQIIAAVCGGLILSMVGSQAAMLVVAGVLLILGAACVGFIKENNK